MSSYDISLPPFLGIKI